MKHADHTASAVAKTETALAKPPPVIREIEYREIALDQAEKAERWENAACGLADQIHAKHSGLRIFRNCDFGNCDHRDCIAARRLLAVAIDIPDEPG